MRYLQLAALTLLCTVVMSMCLMVNRAPTDEPWKSPFPRRIPGALPPEFERHLLEFREREGSDAPMPSSGSPEPTVPRDLPPALEQLRLLELGVRNMILY
jgi:hypothetical protein